MKRAGLKPGLNVQIARSYDAMSGRAEEVIVSRLREKPDLLLCASAGGTPTRLYERLAERARRNPRLFSRMRVLQIDEWGGIEPTCPAACAADLQAKLIQPLRIPSVGFIGFKSDARNPKAECARIERWLARNGPIDICILGLGVNGHIAMNEPADEFMPHPHVPMLAKSSARHPMLRGLDRKPRYGLTLGIADILRSRTILLLVSGGHKRLPLKRLMEPRVTTRFPASCLWLHPDAAVLCDREAVHR
jgi:galactosamine-6-phosphate isomerase